MAVYLKTLSFLWKIAPPHTFFPFSWIIASVSMLTGEYVFWIWFMCCFGGELSQLSQWDGFLSLGLRVTPHIYEKVRGLKTLENQALICVSLGEPIKFLLTQEKGMLIEFPYEAIIHSGELTLTPTSCKAKGNNCLLSSSLWSDSHNIPKLKASKLK